MGQTSKQAGQHELKQKSGVILTPDFCFKTKPPLFLFVALIQYDKPQHNNNHYKKGVEKWKTLLNVIDNYHKTIDNLLKTLKSFQQVTNNFIAVTNNILKQRVYHFTTPTTTTGYRLRRSYIFIYILKRLNTSSFISNGVYTQGANPEKYWSNV